MHAGFQKEITTEDDHLKEFKVNYIIFGYAILSTYYNSSRYKYAIND